MKKPPASAAVCKEEQTNAAPHNMLPREVFSAPHVFENRSSAQIMWLVSACLLPANLWAVWLYGWAALRVLLLSVASCVATEALCNLGGLAADLGGLGRGRLYYNQQSLRLRIRGCLGIDDGSAVVSGLLLGMNLSPTVPFWIPVLGGVFAMAVCKWSFGGLGANWANPALAGRAFVFFSFGREMSVWAVPRYSFRDILGGILVRSEAGIDALSAATPLSVWQQSRLRSTGTDTIVDTALQGWSKVVQLEPAEAQLALFLGVHASSIGEASILLLLLGAAGLLALRIIRWHTPLAFIGSFALLVWVFGGLSQGQGFFSGEVLFQLCSGGLMLGAWFMATDYASAPQMPVARLIFGAGCGALTFLIRFYGPYPEGVMLAILFMNIWTPTLDICFPPRLLGSTRRACNTRKAARRMRRINRFPTY